MRPTTTDRTRAVLELVFQHRQAQEARYGEVNKILVDGTGPETRWLLPYTNEPAWAIQSDFRDEYESYEEETGAPTWLHLVREEIAEAFQEEDPAKLAEELIQVAALCVSWVERLIESPPADRWEILDSTGEVVVAKGEGRELPPLPNGDYRIRMSLSGQPPSIWNPFTVKTPVAHKKKERWRCHCGDTVGCRPGHCLNTPA